ncbi:MAG: hypothetical protein O6922_00525 [Chloroflexi bacterium]|nr:hypothetical protein [Chloroflexota bacterium]
MEILTYRSHRRPALLALLVALVLAALTTTAVAVAQDGTPDGDQDDGNQIIGYRILGEVAAGPHLIQVQVSPPTPKEGILRFAVRVKDLETGEDIDGAIVGIFGTPSEQGDKQYSPALNSPFDPIFYLAQLEFEDAGIWAVDIEIESELGFGTTVLSLQVIPRTRGAAGSGWGTALYLIVSLALVGGGSWLWYTSKKARHRQKPQKLR